MENNSIYDGSSGSRRTDNSEPVLESVKSTLNKLGSTPVSNSIFQVHFGLSYEKNSHSNGMDILFYIIGQYIPLLT